MTMHIPGQFYYTETQSTVTYSRTPTGTLAINELIAGKPCWIPPTLPRTAKPKTLILADWTAPIWSSKKINDVEKTLAALMDQGFSISIWQAGKIKPLDKDLLCMLTDVNVRRTIKLAFEADIIQAAKEQSRLSQDKIQVIDYYWLNHLISGHEELEPRVLRVEELRIHEIMDDTPERETFVKMITTCTPALSTIIDDSFSEDSDRRVTLLTDLFQSIPIKRDYKIAFFSKPLTQSNLHLDDIKNIQEATFEHNDSFLDEMINTIIAVPTGLKQLNLRYYKRSGDHLNFNAVNLASIEEIDLYFSKISLKNLERILAAAPQLKKIILDRCDCLDRTLSRLNINLSNNSLSSLEEIQLTGSISLKNLEHILAAAPQLKKIILDYCDCLNQGCLDELSINLSNNSLSSLEEITLHGDISLENLEHILAAAPQLKKIDLPGRYDERSINLPNNALSNLEDINLHHSRISLENLERIFEAAPQLKKIDLHRAFVIENRILNLQNNALSNLEEIDLSYSKISFENLKRILAAAPQLKRLKLKNWDYLENDLDLNLPNNALSNLEEIDLSDSKISFENLKRIIAAAPQFIVDPKNETVV